MYVWIRLTFSFICWQDYDRIYVLIHIELSISIQAQNEFLFSIRLELEKCIWTIVLRFFMMIYWISKIKILRNTRHSRNIDKSFDSITFCFLSKIRSVIWRSREVGIHVSSFHLYCLRLRHIDKFSRNAIKHVREWDIGNAGSSTFQAACWYLRLGNIMVLELLNIIIFHIII